MPFFPGVIPSQEEEVLARMEEARLREQQANNQFTGVSGGATSSVPEAPGFLSRAVSNFGGALGGAANQVLSAAGSSPLGEAVLGGVPEMLHTIPGAPAALDFTRLPALGRSFAEMATSRETLEKPWLDAPNRAVGTRAAALAAERLTNVKATPEAQAAEVAAQSDFDGYRGSRSYSGAPTPSSRMLVTIDGKTYDYSDPNVRAPKLTGDTVNLRPRGPGAFASYYDPATKNVQVGQRLQEVATLPEKFRPGVSTMEPSYRTAGREQLREYQTRQALGEARRGAERAEMSPREAAMLDPRVIAEQIKLQKPERIQQAMLEISRVTGARTAEEYANNAVTRAVQADPKLAIAYKHAQAGDTRAQADFLKATAPLKEGALKEYQGMIISVLGSDPYKQDALAGLSLQPTTPGS